MKTQLFSQASYTNKFFASDSHYTGDTPHRVWFDLDSSLIRRKRPFLKFLLREVQKISYEILTFFLGKLYQFFFYFSLSLN